MFSAFKSGSINAMSSLLSFGDLSRLSHRLLHADAAFAFSGTLVYRLGGPNRVSSRGSYVVCSSDSEEPPRAVVSVRVHRSDSFSRPLGWWISRTSVPLRLSGTRGSVFRGYHLFAPSCRKYPLASPPWPDLG